MTEKRKYRCTNCGYRDEPEVLTKEEKVMHEIQNKPMSPLKCPKCNRVSWREGWE